MDEPSQMNIILELHNYRRLDKLWPVDETSSQRLRRRLTERFVDLMDKVSIRIRPDVLEAWSEIELTLHQFRALALLRQGPQRVSDIAELLGIRLSAATS